MARRARPQSRLQGRKHERTNKEGFRRRARAIVFGTIAFAILTTAGYFLWPLVKLNQPAALGVVAVQMSMAGSNPSRIEARAGEPLTVRLVNMDNQFHTDGDGWHQFAIDEFGVDVKIPPLKTQEITFTPTRSGTFEFYCEVCCGGRENPYMVGSLVVKG